MNVRRKIVMAVAVIGAVVLGGTAVAYGQESRPVPPELVPKAGNVLASVWQAEGVQVYQCAAAGTWAFLEPSATLTGKRKARAIHFRGPSWQSIDDGSLVEARAVANVPVTGTIPLLLLEASRTQGTGVFGGVTYIQRLATSGGVAPTGACTPGDTRGVRYRAEYRFYKAG